MLSERKERDSRFELLRIIAMLMIIFHHIMQKTFEPSFITPEVLKSLDAWQTFGARGVYWMGMVGNYCFMMISGWFLCKSKFTMKKWLTLYAEVFFYSVVIGLIMFLTGKSGKIEFAKCFLALSCSGNWYIWAYLTFFVTVPFLNKLIENLSKKEHLAIAVFFVLIGNVLPCLWFTKWPMLTGSLFPFYVSYFAASYVRIYGIDFFNNKSRNLVLLILSLAFLLSWSVFVKKVGDYVPIFYEKRFALYALVGADMKRILPFFAGFMFLMVFKDLKIRSSKIINLLGSATLGVYLIHENKDFKYFLWHGIFKTTEVQNHLHLIIYAMGLTFLVFNACTLIDILRKKFIEPGYLKLINKALANYGQK